MKAQVFAYYGIFKTLKKFSYFEIFRRPDPSKAKQFPISMFRSHACFCPPNRLYQEWEDLIPFCKNFDLQPLAADCTVFGWETSSFDHFHYFSGGRGSDDPTYVRICRLTGSGRCPRMYRGLTAMPC